MADESRVYRAVPVVRKTPLSLSATSRRTGRRRERRLGSMLQTMAALGVKLGCVFAPLVAFQAYGYAIYCAQGSAWELHQRPWCSSKLPYLYGA